MSTSLRFIALWVLMAIGCSSGTGGCGGLAPLPAGGFTGPKNNNAMSVRISPAGFSYLNSNWRDVVTALAPGRVLEVPIPCSEIDTGAPGTQLPIDLGVFATADQGDAMGRGRMDGRCDSNDLPAIVRITITNLGMTPVAAVGAMPGAVRVELSAEIDTGKVYIGSRNTNLALCLFLSGVNASVRFSTAEQAPPATRLRARIAFTIDQKWDELLAFDVTDVTGVGVCGSGGVPPSPDCLQPGDVSFNGENFCAQVYLLLAQIEAIKAFLLQQLSGPLQTTVRNTITAQSCRTCGMGQPACPMVGTALSTCRSGQCVDPANSRCVPRFLGLEGRAGLGSLLGGFGVPVDSQLDLSLALGHQVTVDTGMTMGTRVGLRAVETAACVPPVAAPPMVMAPPPNFDAEAPRGTPYHVGLSFSSSFLNQTFHHVQQSGALCLSLSTDTVGVVNTGLFKTLLPSLGPLTSRKVRDDSGNLVTLDAPMLIALRPQRPPMVTVGEGTVDPQTKRPINPLLTIDLPQLGIDFYAMLDDRMARLFTITADVKVPLALIFEGCDQVTPALGDVRMLVTNLTASNSELLAEDPNSLAMLIPTVIGLAEPALAAALKPFSLPSVGAFRLKVNAVKGVGVIAGTDAYHHLGLFATLQPGTISCAAAAPVTLAQLVTLDGEASMPGHAPVWPTLTLKVETQGVSDEAEFSTRIDNGLWTTFAPAPEGRLQVTHPRLTLPGAHSVWVRSRWVSEPHGISEPVEVPVVIDFDPPEITLVPHAETGVVEVAAYDTVSGVVREFAYQIGTNPSSGFGPARELNVDAVRAAGGVVTVLARDPAGNVARSSFTVAADVQPTTEASDSLEMKGPTSLGCHVSGGLGGAALAALCSLGRRSRKKQYQHQLNTAT